jgi:hypothetical protein
MGAVIMAIRYIVQIYRLIVLVKTTKEIREMHKYQGMINIKVGASIDANSESVETIETSH